MGFVPQEDVLYSELTVYETLECSANWRLPRTFGMEEKYLIINDTLRLLDLYDIRDQLIGALGKHGISGGERKRTSIGMELVAKPSVLVMDEPTSGLDSASAYTLVKMLSMISTYGVSVIAVLHQPSERIYDLLDDIVLMQQGQAAYIGQARDLIDYLAFAGYQAPSNDQCGPKISEYVMDVLAGLEVTLIITSYLLPYTTSFLPPITRGKYILIVNNQITSIQRNIGRSILTIQAEKHEIT